MTANPATIAGDIMDRLNLAAASGKALDQMAVARLRRDVEKLTAVDPASGWAAESAVESALFHDVAVVAAARHAIRLAPNVPEIILNCSLSLTRVGRYQEAFEVLRESAFRIRGDATLWKRFSDVAYIVGNFSEYKNAFASWKMLIRHDGNYPRIVDVIEEFLSRNGRSQSELSELIYAAQKVLTEQKVRDTGLSFMHISPVAGDHERVSVAIELEADADVVLRVEQTLFDRLDELSLPIETSDLVSVRLKQPTADFENANQIEAVA